MNEKGVFKSLLPLLALVAVVGGAAFLVMSGAFQATTGAPGTPTGNAQATVALCSSDVAPSVGIQAIDGFDGQRANDTNVLWFENTQDGTGWAQLATSGGITTGDGSTIDPSHDAAAYNEGKPTLLRAYLTGQDNTTYHGRVVLWDTDGDEEPDTDTIAIPCSESKVWRVPIRQRGSLTLLKSDSSDGAANTFSNPEAIGSGLSGDIVYSYKQGTAGGSIGNRYWPEGRGIVFAVDLNDQEYNVADSGLSSSGATFTRIGKPTGHGSNDINASMDESIFFESSIRTLEDKAIMPDIIVTLQADSGVNPGAKSPVFNIYEWQIIRPSEGGVHNAQKISPDRPAEPLLGGYGFFLRNPETGAAIISPTTDQMFVS